MNSIESRNHVSIHRRPIATMGVIAALCLLSGCMTKWPHREGIVRADGVYVFHAPGVSGPIPYDYAFAQGLLDGGVEEVRPIDWQSWSAARNLSDKELHETQARRLVQTLRGFHSTSPEARIVLTGHSGGGLIVTRAVEMLKPEDQFVEQVWLLSVAMSPNYDFSKALERTGRMVALSSEHDWFILGAGTRAFGNSDGDKSDAGGRIGFTTTLPGFEHWPYDPHWLSLGNTGDHMTVLSRRFAREGIAPAMLRWQPDSDSRQFGHAPEHDAMPVPDADAYNDEP